MCTQNHSEAHIMAFYLFMLLQLIKSMYSLNPSQPLFVLPVTVQCTKEAYFIVVVARDVTLPNIDLETISLLGDGQGCSHVDSNSAFAIYYFPVTACGSVVMVKSCFFSFSTSNVNFVSLSIIILHNIATCYF